MKLVHTILICALVSMMSGCVSAPTKSATISYSPAIKTGDVIEVAIDVARSMDFPPATKIDKVSGLVDFGNFGGSMLGITAQVRIKSEGELEVNVTRTSAYISLDVNKQADEFREKIEEKLKALGDKAGK